MVDISGVKVLGFGVELYGVLWEVIIEFIVDVRFLIVIGGNYVMVCVFNFLGVKIDIYVIDNGDGIY